MCGNKVKFSVKRIVSEQFYSDVLYLCEQRNDNVVCSDVLFADGHVVKFVSKTSVNYWTFADLNALCGK